MHTTLNQIRTFKPCSEGWAKLLRYLNKTGSDDEPVSIETILESNGLYDALWCLRSVTGREKEMRLLAVIFAREVQHLMTDPRSLAALEVAEAFANGQASEQDLDAARLASYAAAGEASSLSSAATAAAHEAAAYAAYAAAKPNATHAALDTSLEVTAAAHEAADAAREEATLAAQEAAVGEEASLDSYCAAIDAAIDAARAATSAAKGRQINLLLKALAS